MFFFWSISQRNKQNDEWPKLTAAHSNSSRPHLLPLEAIEPVFIPIEFLSTS
jgi:hypothetical protein